MYIGYTNRYLEQKNKRKRIVKGIAIFVAAFLLGCITMKVMAWTDDTPGMAVTVEMGKLTADKPTVSANELTPEEEVQAVEEDTTKLVVLDPGHGGTDEGCSREEMNEKDINLQIALLLRKRLEELGYEVRLTREEDMYMTLEERVALANEAHADIFISIHQNAFEEERVSGVEVFYSSSEGENSKRLAKLLHNNVILYTKAEDRGIRREDELKVIRETEMPSCLVETGFLSNAQERELLSDETYQERIVEGLVSGIELFFHPKTMYLTFDDGPTAENTCAVLDILKERNIKATFFVVGENVRKNPQVAKRIVEEGHTIGIHCNCHEYETLYQSVDSYLADFEAAYQAVYEVTGVETRLFRFPGGSINAYNEEICEDIIAEMTDRGFIYFDWNASLEDAARKNEPEQLLVNARESTLGRRKVVMLAHDIIYNTTLCLEELLEQFPEYRMEPLSAEVEPIQF